MRAWIWSSATLHGPRLPIVRQCRTLRRMGTWTSFERMSAVLAGERPDSPPVSFWHHFAPEQAHGKPAVDAHLQHLDRWGVDFLKVMNDNPYPAELGGQDIKALRSLGVLEGHELGFGRQLELVTALRARLDGRLLFCTTIFNAWAVLRRLLMPNGRDRHGPPTLHGAPTPVDIKISEFLAADRSAVATALDVISDSLANFARRCVEAGADGIFLSVRDDWVNTEANGMDTYREIVRNGDLKILAAASSAQLNMLHVCGVPQDFDLFASYRAPVLNWADRDGGPPIREVISRTSSLVCGGVDNLGTLARGTPADVETEIRDALAQSGGHPMIISPGCTFDPDSVPSANLEAMVRVAREMKYSG